MKPCAEPGCVRAATGAGLCRTHLRQVEAEMANLRTRVAQLEEAVAELKRAVPA